MALLGSTPPLPQPLSTPRVVSAKSRVKTLHRRVRRGTKTKSRPAKVTPNPEAALLPGEKMRSTRDAGSVKDCSPSVAREMVKLVVTGPAALGVTEDGVNRHTAPGGRPPLQAKVIVEWKSPVGVAVSVTGFEVRPGRALVEVIEGDRVKDPAASAMVSVAGAETFA